MTSATRYVVHAELGRGGFATVYAATRIAEGGFRRGVALKKLLPGSEHDDDLVAELVSEAKLTARIRHPNVVPIFDVIHDAKNLALVLDLVEGETLARLLAETMRAGEKMPVDIALAFLVGMLRGLHAAHEATDTTGKPIALVHRDVSPQNVLVGSDGFPRIVDFGIAKALGFGTKTQTGIVKGKMGYMPVEQLAGQPLDRRTDVWAAAVVGWELLAATRLFRRETDRLTIEAVRKGEVVPPSRMRPDVPAKLDVILLRALSKLREDRHATAEELACELEDIGVAGPGRVAGWVEPRIRARVEEIRGAFRSETPIETLVVGEADRSEVTAVTTLASPAVPTERRLAPRTMAALAVGGLVLGVGTMVTLARLRAQPTPPPITSAEPSASPPVSVVTVTVTVTVTSPPPPPPSAPLTAKHTAPPPPPPRPANPCDPPYTVDADGTKHFKRECFK